MAQADHAYTTSRFHNLSNAALADAVASRCRRAAHLGFYLSASFLCRKPQFNEPPEGSALDGKSSCFRRQASTRSIIVVSRRISKRAYPSFFAIVPIREWRRTSINPVRFRPSKDGLVQEVS